VQAVYLPGEVYRCPRLAEKLIFTMPKEKRAEDAPLLERTPARPAIKVKMHHRQKERRITRWSIEHVLEHRAAVLDQDPQAIAAAGARRLSIPSVRSRCDGRDAFPDEDLPKVASEMRR